MNILDRVKEIAESELDVSAETLRIMAEKILKDAADEKPGYHDITIETAELPEQPVPYGLALQLNKSAGWELWNFDGSLGERGGSLLAGEFNENWLIVRCNGQVIVNSKSEPTDTAEEETGHIETTVVMFEVHPKNNDDCWRYDADGLLDAALHGNPLQLANKNNLRLERVEAHLMPIGHKDSTASGMTVSNGGGLIVFQDQGNFETHGIEDDFLVSLETGTCVTFAVTVVTDV